MEMESSHTLTHTLDTTAGCSFSSADPIHSVIEQECVSAATQTLSVTYIDASTQTTEPLHLEMLCNMEASSQNCSTPVESLEPDFSHLHSPNPNFTSPYVLSTSTSESMARPGIVEKVHLNHLWWCSQTCGNSAIQMKVCYLS